MVFPEKDRHVFASAQARSDVLLARTACAHEAYSIPSNPVSRPMYPGLLTGVDSLLYALHSHSGRADLVAICDACREGKHPGSTNCTGCFALDAHSHDMHHKRRPTSGQTGCEHMI